MAVIRLLGLDPGLRYTGFGVIDVEGNKLRHITDGVVATNSTENISDRLCTLHKALAQICLEFRPDEAAVEETYVTKNAEATLKLGYARGVSLSALALHLIPVNEYGARKVKLSLVGTGNADKNQMLLMVKRLLPEAILKRADAADALAVAICHAHHRNIKTLLGR